MSLAVVCRAVLIGALGALAACGAEDAEPLETNAQTPPITGYADIEKWISDGFYKDWACEPTIHVSRNPSPHGFNRICANGLIADNATGTGAWPRGAAAVKELFASATSTTPIGYAVYLKLADSSAGGSNWYWYERVPLDSTVPHDANGVVADGDGRGGAEREICVSCHNAAGSDPEHLPTPGGRDQVYTPVR